MKRHGILAGSEGADKPGSDMAEPLSPFQHDCEGRLSRALQEIGLRLDERTVGIVRGLVFATDAPESYVEARIAGTELKVFIYEDGAEISGGGIDDRFEQADYDSLDELATAFVARAVAHALATPGGRPASPKPRKVLLWFLLVTVLVAMLAIYWAHEAYPKSRVANALWLLMWGWGSVAAVLSTVMVSRKRKR